MSRPTPEAYYKAQLDKAMRNDDTKKISYLMRKLQSLNATKATKTRSPRVDPSKVEKKAETPKASPMPRRRRRPTADPRPTLITKEDTPRRRRRRPTADPRPTPMPKLPRRRRRPTSEAQRQRQAILRRRALARQRARQRALLRGAPKGGDPRTRGQMRNVSQRAAMKRALEQAIKRKNTTQRAKALSEQKLKQLTKQGNARRGKNLIDANRKKLMKLTGGRNLLRVALENSRKKENIMACACGNEDCKCSSTDLIPDKMGYQINKRRMAWVLIYLMAITTVLTLAFPDRLAEAESILMTQYISMCGLVGAYFGFSALGGKK